MEQTQEFWRLLLGGNLLVPLTDDQNAVFVDANCRFGEYALELAYEFPHTMVVGIGSEYNSPVGKPANCNFVVENIPAGTSFGNGSCRFIQSRDVSLSMREENWRPYLTELYRMLEGNGWLQVLEVNVWREYPGNVGGGYRNWSERVFPALAQTKGVCVWGLENQLPQLAAQVGFTDIYPVHYRVPVGDWGNTQLGISRSFIKLTSDPRLVEAGLLLRQNLLRFVETKRALALSIMMNKSEGESLIASARGELYDDNMMACHHVYYSCCYFN